MELNVRKGNEQALKVWAMFPANRREDVCREVTPLAPT